MTEERDGRPLVKAMREREVMGARRSSKRYAAAADGHRFTGRCSIVHREFGRDPSTTASVVGRAWHRELSVTRATGALVAIEKAPQVFVVSGPRHRARELRLIREAVRQTLLSITVVENRQSCRTA